MTQFDKVMIFYDISTGALTDLLDVSIPQVQVVFYTNINNENDQLIQ